MRKLLASLVVVAAVPSLGLAGSLTTTFVGGNGQDGAMFDLTGLNPAGIRITSFDYNHSSGSGEDIEVWYVTDRTTFVGKESTAGLWTLLGKEFVSSPNPTGTPTHVNIGGLEIYQNDTIGLYFTYAPGGSSIKYTNGPLGAFANPDLRFEDRGVGKSYPFASTFSPRIWNGTIYYDVIPEPASLALLALGALALLRRR